MKGWKEKFLSTEKENFSFYITSAIKFRNRSDRENKLRKANSITLFVQSNYKYAECRKMDLYKYVILMGRNG
jgi:hypothetical protein